MNFGEDYVQKFKKNLDKFDFNTIKKVVDEIMNAKRNGKTIFVMGNGGSAATASHFACDLSKSTVRKFYEPDSKRFRAVSLNDNIPSMTAYSNDLSYEEIFSQQLYNLINDGDLVIIITGSGNSPNVINAVKLAKKYNAITIGMLGFNGGKLLDMVDYVLLYESDNYGRIEDAHMMFCHIIVHWIMKIEKTNPNVLKS